MIQKEFGWACKKLREAKGLSQEKFALLIEPDCASVHQVSSTGI